MTSKIKFCSSAWDLQVQKEDIYQAEKGVRKAGHQIMAARLAAKSENILLNIHMPCKKKMF